MCIICLCVCVCECVCYHVCLYICVCVCVCVFVFYYHIMFLLPPQTIPQVNYACTLPAASASSFTAGVGTVSLVGSMICFFQWCVFSSDVC